MTPDLVAILTLVATVVSAITTITITVLIYQWSHQTGSVERSSDMNRDWIGINQLIISDPDMVEIARQAHPIGDISTFELKKIYFCFSQLNPAYTSWINARTKAAFGSVPRSVLEGQAIATFRYRDFIEMHVFPRGYDPDFKQDLRKLWVSLEKKETPQAEVISPSNRLQ